MYEGERCLAGQLFGRRRVMNAAFPLTFLRGLWGGNVYFLGQHCRAHQSLRSWRYFTLCSASCVAFGCRSWAQTLFEKKKNTTHTYKRAQTEQSFSFIIMNWIKSFWLTTDWKTCMSFSLFHISQRLGWNSFFLLFLKFRQDYWRLKSKSTSSSRTVWLAFHAEVRSKWKLFEDFKKRKKKTTTQLWFSPSFIILGTWTVVTPESITGRVKRGLISFPRPNHGWGQSVYEALSKRDEVTQRLCKHRP